MIECPNCKHQEIIGTLFCNECGAQLVGMNVTSAQAHQSSLTSSDVNPVSINDETNLPSLPKDVKISLFILDTGTILPMEGLSEFTLGRSAEGQPILPDVDLTPFQAYENGVSRIHASVTIGEQEALITDLGSANGTRLNGQKLPSHRPYPANHGDIVTLGKLRIQLLIRR